jgi:hypothetical protein
MSEKKILLLQTQEGATAAARLEYHIATSTYPPRHFYVGLTDNLNRELRDRHRAWDAKVEKVDKLDIARQVKEYLTERFTILSEDHGGKSDSIYVYVFRMTERTDPTLEQANAMLNQRG